MFITATSLKGLLAFVCALPVAVTGQSAPDLISPKPVQVMDNGCMDRSNGIEWDFEWEAVAGAKKYQLWVKSDGAPIAAIDKKTNKETTYRHVAPKTYIGGARPSLWTWRVRAHVGSKWTEWSVDRKFQVERLDADCPPRVV